MRNENIGVKKIKRCFLCGNESVPLYQDLRDRLFDAPGKWNLKKCSNPKCGVLWLDPMPLEEDLGKLYEHYYTHQNLGKANIPNTWLRRAYHIVKETYLAMKYGYRSESISSWKKFLNIFIYLHPGRRADLDFSIMYLPARSNGLLLDIGCGSGWLLRRMRDLGWSVEGVDSDPIVVKNARKEGLQVRLGTLEAQQYPDGHFDAITMSHLIEHVYDPLQLLRECRRILKLGGRLIVVTPNAESWGHRIFKNNYLHLDPPRHLHIFTPLSLCHLAEKAGFLKPKISTVIRDANGTFIASRSLQRVGKYVSGSFQPRAIRIWARGMQLLEWVVLKTKPNVGEEILLVSEK